MSVNSSVQQLAAGLAAWFSGMVLGQSANGKITRYSLIGVVSVACALLCIYLSRFLASGQENGTDQATVVVGVEQS